MTTQVNFNLIIFLFFVQQVKDHSSVKNVGKVLQRKGVFRIIKEYIAVSIQITGQNKHD